jgi:DNA-binding GntR family transcriptional regulator
VLDPVSNQATGGFAAEPLLAFSSVQQRTAVADVHVQLRCAILRGRLRPGVALVQEDLAASFSVSRMPIRDALRMLSAEGLVELLPYRGARVALLTPEELEELYTARIGLEGLAARLSATQMSPLVLERMAEALRRIEALGGSSDFEAFLGAEAEYHKTCYSACARDRLRRTVADLRERAERYLRVIFSGPNRLSDSLAHQQALYRACERRDGAEAEAAIQDALRWTLRHAHYLFGKAES